jgi:acetyltransferase-like isoleucine patch superfamily enzyme
LKGGIKFIYTSCILSKFLEFGQNSSVEYSINLKGEKYISIGKDLSLGKNSILNAWESYKGVKFKPSISIGNNTSIGEWCHLTSINEIRIGENVLFGRFVLVTDNSHGDFSKIQLELPPSSRRLISKGVVEIENDVWIGDKVTILPNVIIGHNSIIGANSVVSKNVPPYSVVGGIPAKIIKEIKYIN